MRFTLGLVALLMGCQEYNLQGDPSLYAAPNPPDLGVPVVDDRIVQVTVAQVDVLWMVDNSFSMEEEQTALTANFDRFMDYFLDSGLDYHVGVVSSDMYASNNGDKGKLRTINGQKWIEPDTQNPVQMFSQMANIGTDGNGDERGLLAVYTALETQAHSYNTGFLRPDAFLSVIAISDEEDSSPDPDMPSRPFPTAKFSQWIQGLKSTPDMVSFSSIVGPRGGCPTSDSPGVRYLEVTEAVGGIEWSICSSDWDQVLQQLGMQAAGLRREFFLSQIPVESTIHVWVDTEDNDGNAWTYDRARNSVTFDEFVPDPLAEVHIDYELLSAWGEEQDPAETDAP
jgi:hypothetical protein